MIIVREDLVKKVSKLTGVDAHMADVAIVSFLKLLRQEVTNGNVVHLRKFGVFDVKHKKERSNGHNFQTGSATTIPEKWVPELKPSKLWIEKLAKVKKVEKEVL